VHGSRIDVAVRVADYDLTAVDAMLGAAVSEAAGADTAGRSASVDPKNAGGVPAEAPPAIDLIGAYVSRTVTARASDVACPIASAVRSTIAGDGWRTVRWAFDCPSAGAYTLRADLLFDALPSHVHFARVDEVGRASVERLVTGENRTWTVSAGGAGSGGATSGSSLREYAWLGVQHILSGYDHVAFLVALLLLARTLGEVALVVTSFTVAHSLTLALAALGIARPDPHGIEALIGFSIALVAIENAWLLGGRPKLVPVALTVTLVAFASAAHAGLGVLPAIVFLGLAVFCASHFALMARVRDAARLRVVVAFCFGLAHGFGFAGVLAEIVNDPGSLVRGLLGFNAGVELGQLAIVAAVWPLLVLAQRTRAGAPRLLIAEVGSALVCGLGTFWFIVRALG
jgi:hypothetical protein